MSWFGSNTVSIDAQIEKATDESIPFGETDLATSLEITDLIRSKQVLPKDAMRSLKKRLTSTRNPNTQLSTLHLIDTCVKNGGNHFIVEISTREFIDTIVSLIHDDKTNENVRDLALDLIQNWAIAFKENFQFKYVVSTYEHLKSDGYTFPAIGSEISSKLFDSSAPPEWEDSDACMICSTLFSMLNRKHHCRNCGGVFCQTHSSKSLPLSHLGITEPVRVCDNCYDELSSKTAKSHKSKKSRRSKHQKEVSRARAQYDSDDDEDLKKALELSLRESQGYTQVPIPVVPAPKSTANVTKSMVTQAEEEDDDDMKAAIAASLRDLEEKKAASANSQQVPLQQDNSPYANLLPQSAAPYQPQSQQQQPPQFQSQQYPSAPKVNVISSQEEADIRQFAAKVDYYKSNPGSYTDTTELHEHYKKAIPLTPKLSTDLNDSIDKYDRFVDMNSKIDTVMRLYNKMLDERIERESNYQRQQYQPYQQPQQQAPYQQQYQQYAGQVPQSNYIPPQEPVQSPDASYYRPPSQIPQYNQAQQSPYQQSQPINSVQSPVAAPQQPQYSGSYAQSPTASHQQPQYQQEDSNPPVYSNQYASEYSEQYQPPTQQSEETYQASEDPFKDQVEEEEEEEDEFTAPPAQQSSNDQEQRVYEPTPQHVVQPDFTGESTASYSQSQHVQQQQQQVPSAPYPSGNITSPQQANRIPQQYQRYGQQAPLQGHYQPKVTDVTFPNVPMSRPPQLESQPPTSVPPVQQKEEQLIEL